MLSMLKLMGARKDDLFMLKLYRSRCDPANSDTLTGVIGIGPEQVPAGGRRGVGTRGGRADGSVPTLTTTLARYALCSKRQAPSSRGGEPAPKRARAGATQDRWQELPDSWHVLIEARDEPARLGARDQVRSCVLGACGGRA